MTKEVNTKERVNKALTYEELENAAHQLSDQNRTLYNQNNELTKIAENTMMLNFFRRLDYLNGVIHSTSTYFPDHFKTKCAEEFMLLMEQTENKEEPTEETKEK